MEKQTIAFLTDSACDIPEDLARRYSITVMSIPINVDGKEYLERVDFTNQEFYDILENCKSIPSTSHVPSVSFVEEYQKAMDNGITDLIHVTINSKGSNMYHAALMARDQFYEECPQAKETFRIHVMDSRTYTIAYGCGIVEAAKLAEEGKDAEMVLAFLENWFSSIEIYFSVYSLDFVKKSGRVSVAAAFVGELLGLRPIIRMLDGDPVIIDKVRGDKAILSRLLRAAKESMEQSGLEKPAYYIIHGSPAKEAQELENLLEQELGYPACGSYEAGAAISINSGPRVIGVILKGKDRR